MAEINVSRWHCHPDSRLRLSGDTIDRHQKAVADLVAGFVAAVGMEAARAADLDQAALIHDECERVMGDWPGPLLDMFPLLRPVKWLLERAIRRSMGIHMPRLDRQQRAILHLADKLEAELWARRHGVTGTHDCDKLQSMADKLGLGEMVQSMLKTKGE